jgi:PAS domain S-box-containing protein
MTRRKPKRKKQNAAAGSRLAALEAEVLDLREQLALERLHFDAALDSVAEAKRDLELSSQRYFDLYETAPIAYILLDRNGFIYEANLPATRMFGQPKERLRRTLLSRFVCKEDHRKLLCHLNRCRKSIGDEDVATEVTVAGADGRSWDVLLTSRTQPAPSPAPAEVRFRTALMDITARKQAEQKLRESEERFRSFFENAASGAAQIDANGRFTNVNDRFCQITGYSREELLNKMGPVDLDHPDEVEADRKRIADFFLANAPYLFFEKRYVHKTGKIVWVRVTVAPIRDDQGAVRMTAAIIEDITERKRAEDALRQAELRFRTMFKQAGAGVALVNSQTGRFEQVNRRYCELVGLSEEEMQASTFMSITHPDDLAEDLAFMERLRSGEIPAFTMEKRYVRKDGSFVWVDLNVAPLWEPGEHPSHHIAIVQDITERKTADARVRLLNESLEQRVHERTAELAEANERWDWVVRATNDGVWDWDLVRDTAYFSPRWKEMHGFQERDRLESTQEWRMRIHPEDRQSILDHLAEYLCGKRGEFWEEYRIQRKDGTYMWVLDRGVAIKDEQGRAVRMVGAETDITWRKEAEQALRFREQQFHALADNVPAHFAYIDRSRRYQFLNKHCEALFQRPAEALQGMSVQDLLGPEDYAKLKPFLDQALAGEPVSFEYRRQLHGDGMRYLSGQYVPDRDDQGNVRGVLALMTDITTLKSNEALLRAREAQLRELGAKLLRAQEEERRRISRDLHDDVMQRMGALALELYGLASTTSSQDEGLQSQLKSFGASAEQLTTDLQRMAHQLHPSVLEFGGLETALREQVDEFGSRTGISAEFITKDVPKDIPLDHATCLYRIVQEGLQNVQKHAEATTVLVRLMRTGRGLGLCIHDDGRGVENVDGATQRKGLGLTSMAERVGMLNGVFRIRAKPGQGTELHAWVPLEGGET